LPLAPADRPLAPRDVAPEAWLATIACRAPLVLAPDGAGGWFGGQAIVAFDPVDGGVIAGNGPEALHAAGDVLERALLAREPRLAVALLPYTGDVRWAIFERGLVRDARGWRTWGSEPEGGWEALARAAAGWEPDSDTGGRTELATPVRTSLTECAYRDAVEATREAIRDGSVYVLNLTRTVEAECDLAPAALFAQLAQRAPATMASAWLPQDGAAIVSVSPERFIRLVAHEIEIAPVKGTRARGATPEEDVALVDELLGSEKERAEHVMVVDMERNDIGRVCVAGSVRVDPLYRVETTSYCHQAVSSVRGLVRPDASVGDVLEATFPSGSVTGAPKIAAMRIAGELETGERGAYTGSLVVAVPGEIDSSVLIRTVEADRALSDRPAGEQAAPAGRPAAAIRYGTGCGITIDSDAQAEWDESVLKTRPLLGHASAGGHAPAGDTAARDPYASAPVALKETCRVANGAVPLWPYHRARLAGGGCGPALLDAVEAAVSAAAAEWAAAPTRRARLTVVVEPGGAFEVEVAQRLSSLDVVGGLTVARVDVADAPPLPADPAKPADRAWWDAAHHAAERGGAHQAALVDPAGLVVDGSTACVWIVEGGTLVTPPAPPAIPSVSRAFVLANAERAGLTIRVEPISWLRFEAADEAFFTNAFGGAAAVRGRSGEVFSAVKGLFDEAWRTDV
jgi:anthranilate/para-aminobenzoate synthase component I/branched-subunit amino acid aminotransferase/4-amino-4-deoxychorismate lyase